MGDVSRVTWGGSDGCRPVACSTATVAMYLRWERAAALTRPVVPDENMMAATSVCLMSTAGLGRVGSTVSKSAENLGESSRTTGARGVAGSLEAVEETAKAMAGFTTPIRRDVSDGVEAGLAGETMTPMERRARQRTGRSRREGERMKATSPLERLK